MDKTKYYYLKIKENFFDTEDMKLLEAMENGYLYSNILMKMYLLSLKNGGKLIYKDTVPYNAKMLSTILNHNIDIVDKAVNVFKTLNLIDVLDSGEIFMLDIQNYIGRSSDEADRKREYRTLIAETKQQQITTKDKCPDKCQTDLSHIKDRDKDKVKDKDIIKMFDEFWLSYPRKVNKQKALSTFTKLKPTEELFAKIMWALQNQKQSSQWQKDNGQFIPHPSTWLNNARWEDEVMEQTIENKIDEAFANNPFARIALKEKVEERRNNSE